RDLAGGEAEDDEASAPRDAAQCRLGPAAADRVAYDVDAATAQRLEPLAQILGLVVDRLVGAVLAARAQLFGRGSGGDHTRTQRLGDLDRRHADAACRAEHEHRLARLELPAVAERVIAGAVGHQQRTADIEG